MTLVLALHGSVPVQGTRESQRYRRNMNAFGIWAVGIIWRRMQPVYFWILDGISPRESTFKGIIVLFFSQIRLIQIWKSLEPTVTGHCYINYPDPFFSLPQWCQECCAPFGLESPTGSWPTHIQLFSLSFAPVFVCWENWTFFINSIGQ